MKIASIIAQNFQGLGHIALTINGPAVLIAGANGAGKSSIHEAVRFAILGESTRVGLKKDFPTMVREGAKKGVVSVTMDVGTTEQPLVEFRRDVATGKGDSPRWEDNYLPFVLDAHKFAAMDDVARRSFLFSLMGVEMNAKTVKERLARRGCDVAKVDTIVPFLRSGFPAATDEAKRRATEARGAWKAITGEAYGDKKAEDWAAHVPDRCPAEGDVAAARADVQAADEDLNAANTQLGAMQEQARAAADQARYIEGIREKATSKGRIQQKLEVDERDLAGWKEKLAALPPVPGQCKTPDPLLKEMSNIVRSMVQVVYASEGVAGYHKNGDVADWGEFEFLLNAADLIYAYDQQYTPKEADPETERLRAEYTMAVDLCERAVANDRRDLAQAEAAADELQRGQEDLSKAPTESDLASQRAKVETLKTEKRAREQRLHELQEAFTAAVNAKDKTAKAAVHHADVQAWGAIADALAPDGIPGELLAEALAPFNDRLRHTAGAAGWAQVAISADMAITANGRAYGLLSESERWRVDAMLAEAIANRSGLGLLFLDRLDVLDVPARRQALDWLNGLTSEYGTILATGTFKELPFQTYGQINGYWIEKGEILTNEKKAA